MMDCAAFENRLTEWLAGDADPATGLAALDELKRHAASCPHCAGAVHLVELATLPVAERDPVGDPPTGYWEGFNASVERRIDTRPVTRGNPKTRTLAAAAMILLALAAGWFLRGRFPSGPEKPAEVAQQEAWNSLEEVIREATPEELASTLR